MELKIALKNWRVQEIGGEIITVFDWGDWNDYWFELSEGSRNWDSTVVILNALAWLQYKLHVVPDYVY